MSDADRRLKRFLAGDDETEPPGRSPLDRYRIVRPIGSGASSTVYEAEDLDLGRRVALKIVPLDRAAATLLDRVEREARVLARLRHPNIVEIHDAGLTTGPAGEPCFFLVMDFVEGGTLGDLPARRAPLTELLRILEDLAGAVAHAHQNGIVHRDLKPANVLVEEGGRVLLVDFGLARKLSPDRTRLTATGAMVGTPAYMAPEQVRGDDADERTDVYALGVILYETLTGRLPYEAATPFEMCRQILESDAARPAAIDPAIAPEIESVCVKAMDPEPGRRYAGAAEFAAELRRFRNREPVLAPPVSAAALAWPRLKRRPALLVAAALAAALAGWLGWARVESSRRLRDDLDEARRFEAAGDIDTARDRFRSALDKDEDHPEARAGLARTERERERRAAILRANEILDAVASLMAKRELREEEIETVERECAKAMLASPGLGRAHMFLGRVHDLRGEAARAMEEYSEAIRLDPGRVDAYRHRGDLRMDAQDTRGAIEDFTEILKFDPEDFDALLGRGTARRRSGDLRGAISDLSEAERVNPRSPNTFVQRGLAYEEMGDLDAAFNGSVAAQYSWWFEYPSSSASNAESGASGFVWTATSQPSGVPSLSRSGLLAASPADSSASRSMRTWSSVKSG